MKRTKMEWMKGLNEHTLKKKEVRELNEAPMQQHSYAFIWIIIIFMDQVQQTLEEIMKTLLFYTWQSRNEERADTRTGSHKFAYYYCSFYECDGSFYTHNLASRVFRILLTSWHILVSVFDYLKWVIFSFAFAYFGFLQIYSHPYRVQRHTGTHNRHQTVK